MASLTPDEVQRMRTVVRVAERLKARLSAAQGPAPRQAQRPPHAPQNLSTGGEPYKLVFRPGGRTTRDRRALRRQHSVRNVSRLMLQFVYTLQELYARVRSFVFVSDIGEVTHLSARRT